jgi:hypothetical protein|tara:strand:- start:308 stop:1021 length:714 start_codon:yes stop_codon:yes gene_type:complete
MIIARAILNLEKTKKEIYAGNPWVNHRAEVKNYFLRNKDEYYNRIFDLINIAKYHNADIFLLPAIGLVYSNRRENMKYLNYVENDMLIASGTLDISKKDGIEKAIFYNKNNKIDRTITMDSVYSIAYRGIPIYGAISSTISNLYTNKSVKELDDEKIDTKKYIAVDMGHHQYSGRYMLSIRRSHRFLMEKYGGKHLVLLSFWRFNGGNINSDWFYSNLDVICKRHQYNNDIIDILEY